jgi:hypothetical protein
MSKLVQLLRRLPAAAAIALIVLWAFSIYGSLGVVWPARGAGSQAAVRCERSSIDLSAGPRNALRFGPYWQSYAWKPNDKTYLGELSYSHYPLFQSTSVLVPFPLLLTVVGAIALVSRRRFRLRIWQLLALTAILAAELAYYSYWQN